MLVDKLFQIFNFIGSSVIYLSLSEIPIWTHQRQFILFEKKFQLSYQCWMMVDRFVFPVHRQCFWNSARRRWETKYVLRISLLVRYLGKLPQSLMPNHRNFLHISVIHVARPGLLLKYNVLVYQYWVKFLCRRICSLAVFIHRIHSKIIFMKTLTGRRIFISPGKVDDRLSYVNPNFHRVLFIFNRYW